MDELSVDRPGRGTPTGVFWRGAGGAARLTEPARGPGLRLHPEAASPAPDAQALKALFIEVNGKVQWRSGPDQPWQSAKVDDVVTTTLFDTPTTNG